MAIRIQAAVLRGRPRDRGWLFQQHPAGAIPIEEIVEFRLGINIVPMRGLHADHDIHGILSADMAGLSVDLYVLESWPARYRFTLAHEAAHLVLHKDALMQVMPTSTSDWKRLARELSEKDRERLEWQALRVRWACFGSERTARSSLWRSGPCR